MKQFNIIAIIVLLFAGYNSMITVSEGKRGIVIRFGKVLVDPKSQQTKVYSPGLHFKLPLIDRVYRLDARIQTLDVPPDRFITLEKKDLIIDSYVKWRISDFSRFYLATGGDVLRAETLLNRRVSNGLRSEVGQRTISEIVSGERGVVMETALKRTASSSELGVSVLDVRIKQINLPDEVSSSIYQRMRAERTAVAKQHRSQGREQSAIIRATVDAKVAVMLADAKSKAKQVKGKGEAIAAKIYADSYNKDQEFFAFWRSLQSYKKSFNHNKDILVISPESDFFHYMNKTE